MMWRLFWTTVIFMIAIAAINLGSLRWIGAI